MEIPPCYRGLADAIEAYENARRDGFDGGLNEFLETETWHINRDEHINNLRRGAQGLMEMGERALLRGIAAQILDEAS